LVTVSPTAKKILSLVGIGLLLYFVISRPGDAGALVQSLIGLLQRAAESLITFFRSLLP
jgi:hypothetical protein